MPSFAIPFNFQERFSGDQVHERTDLKKSEKKQAARVSSKNNAFLPLMIVGDGEREKQSASDQISNFPKNETIH